MKKRLLALLLTLGLGAGCDSSDFDSLAMAPQGSPQNGVVDIQTAPLTVAGGGVVATQGGHTLRVPSNVLTADTVATLTQLDDPPSQPPDPDFRAVGDYLQVDLGQADLTDEVEVSLPLSQEDPEDTYVQLVIDGNHVPLPSTVDQQQGVVTARFNPALLVGVGSFDTSSFLIGAGNSGGYNDRVPHVNWSSWNAYVFQNGAFQQFVDQGQTIASVEVVPGAKPVVLVHGFGSDASRFTAVAQALVADGYTSVLAFEYDTLAPVTDSGAHLSEFYSTVTTLAPNVDTWHHLGHSMGVLVSRQCFESGGATYDQNKVVLAGGANLGSPVVDKLKANPTLFTFGMNYLLSQNLLDFRNADGSPCQAKIDDQGFQDLASTSQVVQDLSQGTPASNHPLEEYRTVAGTDQGQFKAADQLLGISPEDGVITLESANANFIGALDSEEVAFDHVAMLDNATSIATILSLLNE